MNEPFAYDVFLSYSSKDKQAVRELAQRLKKDGLRVWFDEWEIKPGDLISLKVEQGLEQSRTLVLVMSANAFASDWVMLERHTAIFRDPTNAERRFIPLRLDDTEIKDTLKQFSYVDWMNKSQEHYTKLLAAIRPIKEIAPEGINASKIYPGKNNEINQKKSSLEYYSLDGLCPNCGDDKYTLIGRQNGWGTQIRECAKCGNVFSYDYD